MSSDLQICLAVLTLSRDTPLATAFPVMVGRLAVVCAVEAQTHMHLDM